MADLSNLTEDLFESMSIISKKQLESLSFDKTIDATVTDASKAKDGIYVVSTGNTSFIAYSTESGYQKDDVVMVTIPQGDFDKQKMIIGKQVDNSNTSLVYKSPFQQFIDVSGNLISKTNEVGFYANSAEDFNWEMEINNFQESKAYQNTQYYRINGSDTVFSVEQKALIWDSNNDVNLNLNETQFTRLGIKADFSTWLNDYNTTYGNYGLAIVLTFTNKDSKKSFLQNIIFDSEQFFGDVYNFETYYTQEAVYNISEYNNYTITHIQLYAYQRNNFRDNNNELIYTSEEVDSDILFGSIEPNIFIKNPYICLGIPKENFDSDVAEIIIQPNNTYYKYTSEEDTKSDIMQNLINLYSTYISDLKETQRQITSGEITEEEYENQLNLYQTNYNQAREEYLNQLSISSLALEEAFDQIQNDTNTQFQNILEDVSYEWDETLYASQLSKIQNNIFLDNRQEENEKILSLRWVHKNPENDVITAVLPEELPPNYHINWYYYELGAPSPDGLAGAHWKRFYGCKKQEKNNKDYYFSDDNGNYCITLEEINNQTQQDSATDKIDNIIFIPNQNKSSEKIKAVVFKKDIDSDGSAIERLIVTSPILELTNQTEIRNEATVIDENALSIRFEDEEKGNYFLYNRARKLYSKESNQVRTLTAVFDLNENNLNKKDILTPPNNYIKWIFPISNTMIIPLFTDAQGEIKQVKSLKFNGDNIFENYRINKNEDTYEYISTDIDGIDLISVNYYIVDQLSFNNNKNIVYLEINKDGQIYKANVEMLFGVAGTSGSNYTINVTWNNNSNNKCVFDINKGKLYGEVTLFDQGQPVILNSDAQYEYSWYKVQTNKNISEDEFPVLEDKDIYYPIQNNSLSKLYERKNIFGSLEDVEIEVDYLINSNENLQCAIYNLNSKQFETSAYNTNHIMYRKLTSEENKKNKIEFRPFDRVEFIQDQQGFIEERNEDGKKIRILHYDDKYKERRAFIKYNDIYIIDPWDSYVETETYYEPIYTTEKQYESDFLLNITPPESEEEKTSNVNNQYFIITDERENNFNRKILSNSEEYQDFDDLYILQIKLTNFGDYDLITRVPIPLKNSGEKFVVYNIEGPSTIRYGSDGEIDYEKAVYKINFDYEKEGLKDKEEDALKGHWELIYENKENLITNDISLPQLEETNAIASLLKQLKRDNNYKRILALINNLQETEEQQQQENNDNEEENEIIEEKDYIKKITEIITAENYQFSQIAITNITDSIVTLKNILQKTSQSDKTNFIKALNELNIIQENEFDLKIFPSLLPPGIYFKENSFYGIRFIIDENILDKNNDLIIPANTTLWVQPIYVYQDNYPSTTLNRWNGKDIITDNDTGIISANGFSAGKKENDNTFTGVVLGDWSKTDSDKMLTKQTGIYGFNHGAMSYALKDDGTAFFGKDGQGRIYFNGNSAQIYSANWIAAISKENNLYTQKKQGMLIDVDDGLLDIRKNNYTTTIQPGEFILTGDYSREKKEILNISKNKNFLQSVNYDTSINGARLDLNSGSFKSLDGITYTEINSGKIVIKGQKYNSNNVIVTGNQQILLNIQGTSNNYYLQSANYTTDDVGKIISGTKINLSTGNIENAGYIMNRNSSNRYIKLQDGRIYGGDAASTNHGYIDFTSSLYEADTGNITYGINIDSRHLFLNVSKITTGYKENGNYIRAFTGYVPYVSNIGPTANGGVQWQESRMYFWNGILINSSK